MIPAISTPATSCTYGKLSAPSALMKFDCVAGLTMLYAVIARNEYANIISAAVASCSCRSTARRMRRRPREFMLEAWDRMPRPAARQAKGAGAGLGDGGAGTRCDRHPGRLLRH